MGRTDRRTRRKRRHARLNRTLRRIKKVARKNMRHMRIKDHTPPADRTLGRTVSRSFSPPVNLMLRSARSASPDPDVLRCPGQFDISIIVRGKRKCVGWNTRAAKSAMLRNLHSKKPPRCRNIIAPKQYLANCWFNAFFMAFFVSDKGRKFFKYMREAMITGVLPGGERVASELRRPLFLLNKYVEASLRGKDDTTRLAEVMDTNAVIREVYRALRGVADAPLRIPKTRTAWNPLDYYEVIAGYLTGKRPLVWRSYIDVTIDAMKRREKSRRAADVLFLELTEKKAAYVHKPRDFTVSVGGQNRVYKLDSVVLRDNRKQHFTAYLTCNRYPFAFDGMSFSRIAPFAWPRFLNSTKTWEFVAGRGMRFSFQRGYQILAYYRHR